MDYSHTLIPFIGITQAGYTYEKAVALHSIKGVESAFRGKTTIIKVENSDFKIFTKEPYYSVLARIKCASEAGLILSPFEPHKKKKIKTEHKERIKNKFIAEVWVLRSEEKIRALFCTPDFRYKHHYVYIVTNKNRTTLEANAKTFVSKKKAEAYLKRYIKEDVDNHNYIPVEIKSDQTEMEL